MTLSDTEFPPSCRNSATGAIDNQFNFDLLQQLAVVCFCHQSAVSATDAVELIVTL